MNGACRILVGCLLTVAGSAPVSAQVTTTADFTRWIGDVYPSDLPGWFEVLVNGQTVPPNGQTLGGFAQGEILLPGPEDRVEFRNGQPGLPFNAANVIAFAAHTAPAPGDLSEAFKLGTLTITNGIWFAQARVDVTFTTNSALPAFHGHSFSDTLVFTSTPNSNLLPDGNPDHAANADIVSFLNHPGLGTVHVYEANSGLGNMGSVELWGRFGSLEPAFLANPSGGLFLQPVPEPASVWLWLGAALVGWHMRLHDKRRRSEAA